MTDTFRALLVNNEEEFNVRLENLSFEDLPEGDVTIKVHYSSINYKDGLAAIPDGKIVKSYPFVPGIDLAGTVVSSDDSRYEKNQEVIVTSYGLGVSHYGGYSEYARVPGDWVVPLPEHLTMREAMIYGTAGFTAALSIYELEENGMNPESGDILVTGATGGVGSMAISMLAQKKYHVVASTGQDSEREYLENIGAKEVISREDVMSEKMHSIGKQRWGGAVDPVGGETLASILSHTKYGCGVAVSGLTGGGKVPTSVYPFILRGVSLLGIDSVYCPKDVREAIWKRMASDLKPEGLADIANEISLEELPQILPEILSGNIRGRTVVKVASCQ